ncbi:MAG: type III-A CRISPR-associated protein Csm2 [Bacteroidia bacterium]|nr:type III-A CRISPR-associated protein Csm2 [Bacteroidia bacterium]MDW8301474.1 type III-A CRISPR-associated protein Csm2 [Bacteroidia bacterium]
MKIPGQTVLKEKKTVEFKPEQWEEWITRKEGLPREAIEFCEVFAYDLIQGSPLTTSQIRNFFGEVRRIQLKGFEQNKMDFYMLKPKLAYNKSRQGNENKIHLFYEVVSQLIDKVNDEVSYNNFATFIEAVIAYHKAHGGK